jgi:hypothetical protein
MDEVIELSVTALQHVVKEKASDRENAHSFHISIEVSAFENKERQYINAISEKPPQQY